MTHSVNGRSPTLFVLLCLAAATGSAVEIGGMIGYGGAFGEGGKAGGGYLSLNLGSYFALAPGVSFWISQESWSSMSDVTPSIFVRLYFSEDRSSIAPFFGVGAEFHIVSDYQTHPFLGIQLGMDYTISQLVFASGQLAYSPVLARWSSTDSWDFEHEAVGKIGLGVRL